MKTSLAPVVATGSIIAFADKEKGIPMEANEIVNGAKQDGTSVPTGLLAAVSIIAALGAASCCVVPLALFMVGVSGAWISNLTALAKYQPLFVAGALGCLALGFVRVYRRPKETCVEGSYCASPALSRIAKIGLWTATALIIVAVIFPHLAPFFLNT